MQTTAPLSQIKQNPIHWKAGDCQEVCTQITEQLPSDAYREAVSEEVLTGEHSPVLQAHEQAIAAVQGAGEDDSGYLIWAYMVLPAIERAVEAGAWDREAAIDFFTDTYK